MPSNASDVQPEPFTMDIHGKRVMIGLSGGINSMAVLCWLATTTAQPSELHLYYAHFKEHSPDTWAFVRSGIEFARSYFPRVVVRVTRTSVLEYFRHQRMIPHPTNGTCSKYLKILPMQAYSAQHGIEVDLIGYVRHELKRRSAGQSKRLKPDLFSARKLYPIGEFSDEWCLNIVDEMIGWHPRIYDHQDSQGGRLFKHNNCLPCKNMYPKDIEAVQLHYSENYRNALQLSAELKRYWGRDEAEFYATFGRDLAQESTCTHCTW